MKKLILFILMIQAFTLSAQETDAWTSYMTPCETHTMLANYSGNFQLEIEMSGMEKPVQINSHHSMILGGRFLELKQKGSMMGMDYESIFTLGFNTIDHTFSMITISNMGTGTLFLQGNFDDKTKSATLHGEMTNPISKQIIKVRQILTFVDENTILIESFDQEGDHPELKTVEYKFIRK